MCIRDREGASSVDSVSPPSSPAYSLPASGRSAGRGSGGGERPRPGADCGGAELAVVFELALERAPDAGGPGAVWVGAELSLAGGLALAAAQLAAGLVAAAGTVLQLRLELG
eukprot:3291976-Alexandrium_andersonii.AAC.1